MSKLNDIEIIKNLDISNIHKLITHLPEQIYQTYHSDRHLTDGVPPSSIPTLTICGMGGSAIAGDIISVLFSHILSINIVKDYQFPPLSSLNSLFIITTYSGNTEEAISCYQQAITFTENIVIITSGGVIAELAQGKHKIITLPPNLPPRTTIAHIFFTILKLMEEYNLVESHKNQIDLLVGNLMQKAGTLCYKTETDRNYAKSSAESIYPKIPIIYSSCPCLAPVAYRWKCQINENAKMPAFYNSFPEATHNEVEAWELSVYTEKFIPIFLKSFNDKKEYTRRIDKFQKLLTSKKIEYLEFYGDTSETQNAITLQEIFTLIYLGDMISFYLAILNNVDPTEIKNIEHVKN